MPTLSMLIIAKGRPDKATELSLLPMHAQHAFIVMLNDCSLVGVDLLCPTMRTKHKETTVTKQGQ
jgi:hypothetical protein